MKNNVAFGDNPVSNGKLERVAEEHKNNRI